MFRELSIVDALPKLIVLRRSRLRWEQHVQSIVDSSFSACGLRAHRIHQDMHPAFCFGYFIKCNSFLLSGT